MGVRIIKGRNDFGERVSVLYCSTSGRALPPIFSTRREAEAFIVAQREDVRELEPDELERRFVAWRANRLKEQGQ